MPSRATRTSKKKERNPIKKKRISLYAGHTVSNKTIHALSEEYGIESPALSRLRDLPEGKKQKKLEAEERGERYTRSRLFSALVLALASKDVLLRDAYEYYLSHQDYFEKKQQKNDTLLRAAHKALGKKETKSEKQVKIDLTITLDVAALSKTISFKLFGRYSNSLLYRFLLHYFAQKHGFEKPLRGRSVSATALSALDTDSLNLALPEEERPNIEVKQTLSLDRESVREFEQLSKTSGIPKMALKRKLVETVAGDEAVMADLKDFYFNDFAKQQRPKGYVLVRFTGSKTDFALIDEISNRLGELKRSVTMKVIIAYFARPNAANIA